MIKDSTFKPDFLIIPYAVKECDKLRPTDTDVYAVVYWFEHLKEGKCIASNRTIGDIARCTVRAVQNALVRLEKNGFVKCIYQASDRKHRAEIKTLIRYGVVGDTKKEAKEYQAPKVKKEKEEVPLPEWLNKESWATWVIYRREKKKTLTPLSIIKQLELLEEHKADQVEIINNSIRNGWVGLFPLRDKGKEKPPGQKRGRLHDGTKVEMRFGRWVNSNMPTAVIDTSYYPEIAKDQVIAEEEWQAGKRY